MNYGKGKINRRAGGDSRQWQIDAVIPQRMGNGGQRVSRGRPPFQRRVRRTFFSQVPLQRTYWYARPL